MEMEKQAVNEIRSTSKSPVGKTENVFDSEFIAAE